MWRRTTNPGGARTTTTARAGRVDRLTQKIRRAPDVLAQTSHICDDCGGGEPRFIGDEATVRTDGRTDGPTDGLLSGSGRSSWMAVGPGARHSTIITVIDQAQCCPVRCNEPARPSGVFGRRSSFLLRRDECRSCAGHAHRSALSRLSHNTRTRRRRMLKSVTVIITSGQSNLT